MRTRVFYLDWPTTGALAPYSEAFVPEAKWYRYVATIEAESPEDAWESMNRGSGKELALLDEEGLRSMSVGDIIYQGDLYYLCRVVGWDQLAFNHDLFQALYQMIPLKEVEGGKTAVESLSSNPPGE